MMRRIGAAAALLALLLAGGCGGGGEGRGANVLLVTLDTARADRFGCYGHPSIETPAVDSLAAAGVLFEEAYTPIPITLPAHTTILTGLYPHQHGVRDNGVYRVPEELPILPEILREAGYETAAFVSAYVLGREYRIDRGFDVYDEPAAPEEPDSLPLVSSAAAGEPAARKALGRFLHRFRETPNERRAEETVARALEWLGARSGGKPFFLWVHLFDPHTDYTPPDPWADRYGSEYDGPVNGVRAEYIRLTREIPAGEAEPHTRRMIALYEGEVSYADHWIGELLRALPERTLTILAGDHGEAFTEHGQVFEHIQTIHRETVRVPLIFAGAGVRARGERRGAPVSLIDVVPTVLDLLAVSRDDGLPGMNIIGRPSGGGRAFYFETRVGGGAAPEHPGWRGVRSGGWAFLAPVFGDERGEPRLYRTAEDPEETRDLASAEPERADALEAELERLLELTAPAGADTAEYWSLKGDEERMERLRALGYVN